MVLPSFWRATTTFCLFLQVSSTGHLVCGYCVNKYNVPLLGIISRGRRISRSNRLNYFFLLFSLFSKSDSAISYFNFIHHNFNMILESLLFWLLYFYFYFLTRSVCSPWPPRCCPEPLYRRPKFSFQTRVYSLSLKRSILECKRYCFLIGRSNQISNSDHVIISYIIWSLCD